MISRSELDYKLHRTKSHWVITYAAMASPCEILIQAKNRREARHLASLAFSETRRIEDKLSRYCENNIIYALNHSNGAPVDVDEELARLLDYAEQCYRLSDGLFDVTSGVLRNAWTFDGDPISPDTGLIESLRKRVGWDKVVWNGSSLSMQPGMEIDLGGIGKEYGADKVAEMLAQASRAPLMVNFGGDIRAITSAPEQKPWIVGIEDPRTDGCAIGEIDLTNGGVATSGDARRYCLVDGVRLGHILNPLTGWPVVGAPRSVTVLGSYCVEAGFLASLAMLQGTGAEEFLKEQGATGYCNW